MESWPDKHLVAPGVKLHAADHDPADTGDWNKKAAQEELVSFIE
jgi:hypothetical protein